HTKQIHVQVLRTFREASRASVTITITKDQDVWFKTTRIDSCKAQIVDSDDKGQLRVEKVDGKKVLTAKDPQGLLLFSGPVETKEDLDKVPAQVRQRYEKLQQNDLPAIISSRDSGLDIDIDNDSDDEGDSDADIQSMNQISVK